MVLNQIEILLLWFFNFLGFFLELLLTCVGYLAWILSPMHSLCFGAISQLNELERRQGLVMVQVLIYFVLFFCLFSLRKLIYLFIFSHLVLNYQATCWYWVSWLLYQDIYGHENLSFNFPHVLTCSILLVFWLLGVFKDHFQSFNLEQQSRTCLMSIASFMFLSFSSVYRNSCIVLKSILLVLSYFKMIKDAYFVLYTWMKSCIYIERPSMERKKYCHFEFS